MTKHRETLVGTMAVEGEPVFDEDFRLVSYALSHVGVSALEIAIIRNNKVYTIEVATSEAYMERARSEGASEQTSNGEPFVISGEEVLPSDLAAIKAASTEELLPHLVEQVQ